MAMAMDMPITISMKQKMIDIHNHFMYGVDDGSTDIEMTKELLKKSYSQGIKKIFLTPHVNSSVSKVSREIHTERFKIIKELAKNYEIECFLGAEIYISFRLPNLDFSKYFMGKSNYLLIEFSPFMKTPILEHCYNLQKRGYKIIIAHVERYPYLDINDLDELKNMGVLLQVNVSSVVRSRNREYYKRARKYIKNHLIDFLATDSHRTTNRPPELKKGYKELIRLIGKAEAQKLVTSNQEKYLLIEKN